jgi:O-antigen/teichoic acid export membrane protein
MTLIERFRQLVEVLTINNFDITNAAGRSKERYRLILLSSTTGFVAKFFSIIIGLISVPLTINYLGKDQFGLWMVVSSLVAWLQVGDFGISNGLTNALSEANGKSDRISAIECFSSALVATTCISILCIIPLIAITICLPWGDLLKLNNPIIASLARDSFFVAGLFFVLGLPISLITRVYNAYQLGYVVNLIQIISVVTSMIGVLIAIKLRVGLLWLVFLVSIGPLVGNLISWFILHKFIPWLRFDWRYITSLGLRRIGYSSLPLFLFQVGGLLVNQFVNILIARFGSLSMVSDYNILLKIYLLIFSVGFGCSSPFYAAIREAHERYEKEWVLRSVRRVLYIRLGAVIIPGMMLLVWGDRLINLWIKQPLDSEFGFLGWVTFILCMILASISSTISEVLTSLDDIWPQVVMVFISAIIVLSVMSLLIPRIGISGIYIAMSLSTIYPIYWSLKRLNNKI